jgi:hypothetical protein
VPKCGFRGFDRERQGLGLHRLATAPYQEVGLTNTKFYTYITTFPIKIQTLSVLVEWIAQAQLYALVKDDTLQKLRKIYIRNVFDFHIRLQEEQARREVCAALGLSDGDAKGILAQLEGDASYLRLREVKEAMKPLPVAGGQALHPSCTPIPVVTPREKLHGPSA